MLPVKFPQHFIKAVTEAEEKKSVEIIKIYENYYYYYCHNTTTPTTTIITTYCQPWNHTDRVSERERDMCTVNIIESEWVSMHCIYYVYTVGINKFKWQFFLMQNCHQKIIFHTTYIHTYEVWLKINCYSQISWVMLVHMFVIYDIKDQQWIVFFLLLISTKLGSNWDLALNRVHNLT